MAEQEKFVPPEEKKDKPKGRPFDLIDDGRGNLIRVDKGERTKKAGEIQRNKDKKTF